MLADNELEESVVLSDRDFQFTSDELELLFCVNYYAVKADVHGRQNLGLITSFLSSDQSKSEKSLVIKSAKSDWLSQWSEVTKSLLQVGLRYKGDALLHTVQERMREWSPGKRTAFIVEAVTFTPYFPLSKEGKKTRSLSFDEDIYFASLSALFTTKHKELKSVRASFQDAHKEISRLCKESSNTMMWVGIAAAVALIVAPYLAAGIGGLMGLSGAAATTAGLAFLGGGSLAAGGFGMAGGYIVMMAGGAILVHKVGSSIDGAEAAKFSAEELLVSCAKLNASLYGVYGDEPSEGRHSTIKHFCESARQLQLQYELMADDAYLDNDKDEGKTQGRKAAILIGFRRYLRDR